MNKNMKECSQEEYSQEAKVSELGSCRGSKITVWWKPQGEAPLGWTGTWWGQGGRGPASEGSDGAFGVSGLEAVVPW